MTIHQMRKVYEMNGLCEKDIDPDPLVQFRRWFEEARQVDIPDWLEVNAMTLSTACLSGGVASRTVLLKGIADGRLFFYTNYDSDKGQQIAANPAVAMCIFWPHVQRQVRVEGIAGKADRQNSRDYFQSRPRDSQLGAHVSLQSAVVEDREVLERRMDQLRVEFADQPVPCPDGWGGYEVKPRRFEFWQGRPSRLHDRICYRMGDDGCWKIERLSP